MMTFGEYIAKIRTMNLPDALTSLRLAGVSLHTPNREETERLLNREKKRPLAPKIVGARNEKPPALRGGGKSTAV